MAKSKFSDEEQAEIKRVMKKEGVTHKTAIHLFLKKVSARPARVVDSVTVPGIGSIPLVEATKSAKKDAALAPAVKAPKTKATKDAAPKAEPKSPAQVSAARSEGIDCSSWRAVPRRNSSSSSTATRARR
jgi:hypothetical protein